MHSKKLNRRDKALMGARVHALSTPTHRVGHIPPDQLEAFVPTDDEVQACRDQFLRKEKFLADRRRHEQYRRA